MPYWLKSSRRLKRGVFLFILCLVCSSFFLFRLVDRNLRPTIIEIAETKAHFLAIETMNQALYDKILTDTAYEDLMTVHKDAQQRVNLMQANTLKISRLLAATTLEIKEALRDLPKETFQIPLGQATQSPLLAHWGPKIKVKFQPIGTVNVRFVDQFQQAGINQTRHILFLSLETMVQIVIPLVTENITVHNQVPIAETIIVGEVPGTYLGFDSWLWASELGRN